MNTLRKGLSGIAITTDKITNGFDAISAIDCVLIGGAFAGSISALKMLSYTSYYRLY